MDFGVIGYLGFFHFMNERPGYLITADIAIYLHPQYQNRGLGSYLLGQAIERAPALGIEVLTATLFASNKASARLFEKFYFERWATCRESPGSKVSSLTWRWSVAAWCLESLRALTAAARRWRRRRATTPSASGPVPPSQ